MTKSSYPSRKVKGGFWNELFLGYNGQKMKLILFELFINFSYCAKYFLCILQLLQTFGVLSSTMLSFFQRQNGTLLNYLTWNPRAQSGCTWVASSSCPHISACNSHHEEVLLNKSQNIQSRHFPLAIILMNIFIYIYICIYICVSKTHIYNKNAIL